MRKQFGITLALFVLFVGCYQDMGLSPPGNVSGIQGRITFTGLWPDSTKEVRIIAMKHYPVGITDIDSLFEFVRAAVFSGDLAYGDPIPVGSTVYDYRFPLESDLYEWILVAWFPDIEEYFFGVKELGAYYADKEDTIPAAVNVLPKVMMEGIDIIADFANVLRDKPFFKNRETSCSERRP